MRVRVRSTNFNTITKYIQEDETSAIGKGNPRPHC